jgi:hypothetical protein
VAAATSHQCTESDPSDDAPIYSLTPRSQYGRAVRQSLSGLECDVWDQCRPSAVASRAWLRPG